MKRSEHEKKEEFEEKSQPKSGNWSVVILSIILIGLLIAFAFVPSYLRKSQMAKDKYNNFEFVKQSDGYWYTVVNKGDQPYSIPFYYHPRDLEKIILEQNVRDKFFKMQQNNGTIFITLDPESPDNKIVIAGSEIAKITGERYGLLNVKTRSAFTQPPTNQTVNTQTPVVTCSMANNRTMVIWLDVTDKNLISSQGYCIRVEARSYNETVMVADRLMYHLMGIMT